MLSNWKILAVSCLVAGMGLVQTATLAEAGSISSVVESSEQVDAPDVADTGSQYQQRAVTLDGDLSGASAPGGFYTVDTTTIRCPKGHCRIEAIMMVQTNNSAVDNRFAICLRVNGLLGTGCPYIGTFQPADPSEFDVSTSGGMVLDLPKGNHTVEVDFYSDGGAKIYYYKAFIKSFTRKP